MREIPLTKDAVALVDDGDYEKLCNFKWVLSDNGYAIRWGHKNEKKTIFMHCQIQKRPEGFEVDHINGDRLDNQKQNLRIATVEQNRFNRKKQKDTTSRYKGVHWHKQHASWAASIRYRNKLRHLGYFQNEREGALAYNTMAIKLFGEYAKINQIKEEN